jgi:hypothetical protein
LTCLSIQIIRADRLQPGSEKIDKSSASPCEAFHGNGLKKFRRLLAGLRVEEKNPQTNLEKRWIKKTKKYDTQKPESWLPRCVQC